MRVKENPKSKLNRRVEKEKDPSPQFSSTVSHPVRVENGERERERERERGSERTSTPHENHWLCTLTQTDAKHTHTHTHTKKKKSEVVSGRRQLIPSLLIHVFD
jgi:hypothetical protein